MTDIKTENRNENRTEKKIEKTRDRNRILALADALEAGREEFEQLMSCEDLPAFATEEIYDLHSQERIEKKEVGEDGLQMGFEDLGPMVAEGPGDAGHEDGTHTVRCRIAGGDNLAYMMWLLREKKMAGQIQLIYVDPPFFSNAKYQASVQITGLDGKKSPVLKVGAYEDRWGHDLSAYLEMLAVRFFVMRELLSETGCLWVHLDWHGSHYVKMLLDEIFGSRHFINEVAWTYKSGGASKRSFARKHDTLLFYSKTDAYKFHPLREKSYNRQGKPYHFKGVEEFEDEHGWYTMVNMKDVWSIDMVGRTSGERMGYATQKPEKLLERIVDACSDEGDICADFFAGTGTLGAVCSRRMRPWILCDEGAAAIESMIRRLGQYETPFLVEREEERTETGQAETRSSASVQTTLEDGWLSIESCAPDLTQVIQTDREIVAEYIRENSLDLISFWSVDPDYNGTIHLGRQLLDGDGIVSVADGRQISIVGYDIFGGRFSRILR